MQEIINRLIIVAFQWNQTGQMNEALKKQFKLLMTELAAEANTDFEGAMQILLTSQTERNQKYGPTTFRQYGY